MISILKINKVHLENYRNPTQLKAESKILSSIPLYNGKIAIKLLSLDLTALDLNM